MATLRQQFDPVISAPHKVVWGGFESTTTRLQQAGWELSAEQSDFHMGVRLAMRHRDWKIYGVTNVVNVDRFSYTRSQGALCFVVAYMANDITVQTMDNFSGFSPIDAAPQFIAERKSIEDFNIFATPLARTQEIIVDPQDVMAMLERIKMMQAPEQSAIRQRDRLRERRDGIELDAQPRQVFHAQILSIADRRAA